jgi:hypothetical protein
MHILTWKCGGACIVGKPDFKCFPVNVALINPAANHLVIMVSVAS